MAEFGVDTRVDEYIDALPKWQQAISRRVNELVHAADVDVVETIKRSVQQYLVLDKNICALLAAKAHVKIQIYDPAVPLSTRDYQPRPWKCDG